MPKNELGLPLEYSQLSAYYDLLSAGDIDTKNSVIEKILKQYKVKTVLDLTCGTGAQILWLAKCGYQVIGADLSPALLEIAKAKLQQENLAIELIKGDMCDLRIGKFDAVITIFNAIGHLTKTDFEIAIKNIHGNLKLGGLYIFDIFNLEAMTDVAVNNLAMDVRKTVGDTKIQNIQYSKIDREQGLLTSYDVFTIQSENSEPEIMKGEFALQIYSAKALQEMLIENGFEVIEQCGIDGKNFVEDKTINILTVARKI